jgi:hypothetical protein
MRFLGAADVLQRGFHVCQGLPSRNFDRQDPTKNDIKLFKKHYGSDPAVLARMWHDMGETITNESYQMFEPDIFTQRIYQGVCRSKFVNYLKEVSNGPIVMIFCY